VNPYREPPSIRGESSAYAPLPLRKAVCYTVTFAVFSLAFLHFEGRDLASPFDALAHVAQAGWIPWMLPFGALAWIIGVQPDANGDAKARLCRILWNRGQRGTAVGVSIGWIKRRVSQKRADRNARAVERFVRQRRRERYPWIKE